MTLTGAGQTAQLAAVVRDGQGSVISNAAVSWSSSDPGVARVGSGGLVTAVADGETTVTATSGSASGTATVRVRIGTTPSVSVSPAAATLAALGATLQLTAHDENGETITSLTWNSDKSDIASVSGSGLVTAIAPGQATITATAGSAAGTSVVTVRQVATTVSVSPGELTLEIGQTGQLTAEVQDARGNLIVGAPIDWSTTHVDIATVSNSGLVTALAAGSTSAIATSDQASTSVSIQVAAPRELRLIWTSRQSYHPHDYIALPRPLVPESLMAEYTSPAGTRSLLPQEVVWASADTTIAIVRYGTVRGIRQGETVISATFEGQKAEMPVRVRDNERSMLERLYHATDGDNWTNNDGWLSDRPHWAPPGWYGVRAIPFTDDDHIPPANYRSQLLSEMSSNLANPLPPAAFTLADVAWANADPDSLARALVGRVIALQLRDNNLRGQIPRNFGYFFDELLGLDLHDNELQGPLEDSLLGQLGNLFAVNLSGNQFSGALPAFRQKNLFIADLSKNQLSGAVPDRSPALFILGLDGNRLSGDMLDLTLPAHAPLSLATWFNNDDLCHIDSPEIRAEILNRSIIRYLQGPICGLGLDSRRTVVLDPNGRGVRLRFDAARDSSELEYLLLDVYGQEVPQGQDSVKWASSDSAVVTIARHSGRTYLKSEGTGTADVWVAEPELVEPARLFLAVDQVATSVRVPDQTVPSASVAKWTADVRDRNNVTIAKLPEGSSATSNDSTVATPYRNGVLKTGKGGSVQLTVKLPNGLRASGTLRVSDGNAASAVRIDSIRPAVLEGGMAATIYGEALDDVEVLVDGRAASVGAGGPRSVTFTVPGDRSCLPSRGVVVAARKTDGRGAVVRATFEGRGQAAMPGIGEGVLLDVPDSNEICVQMGPGRHLVLAQALPDAGVVIPDAQIRAGFVVRASRVTDDGTDQPAADGGGRGPLAGAASSADGFVGDDDTISRHRQAEGLIRDREGASLSAFGAVGLAAAGAQGTPVIDSDTKVGDIVTLVSDLGRCGVTSANTIRGIVRAVGTYGVVVGDVDNAVDYTNAQYQELSAHMERIVPELNKYFGSFPDVNADKRVTAVFSDKVADEIPGLLGYVSGINLYPKTLCAASDEMEIFFGRTPDAERSYDQLSPILPPLIAHELTHVIQQRRLDLAATTPDEAFAARMESWLAEGQAQLGQEVVGYALGGLGPGNNYGSAVALEEQDGVKWYADSFRDVGQYQNTIFFSGAGSAPSGCSWWARSPSPCRGRSLWYGVSWSFLRWLSDHYGPAYAGGEAGLQTAIIDGREDAWELLSDLTGESFGTLLSGWGAIFGGDQLLASGPYTLPSWDLPQIMSKLNSALGLDQLRGIETIDRVVLGSSKYFLVGQAGSSPRSAIAFRGFFSESPDAGLNLAPAGPPPPIGLQIFVLRWR